MKNTKNNAVFPLTMEKAAKIMGLNIKTRPTLASVKPVCNAELSEASHTPGPWFACWNGFSISIGNAKTGNVKGNHDYTVAETSCNSFTAEANARLIAAAPELLSALDKIAVIAAAGVIHRHETGKPQWSAFDEIKSIIRQARGQEASE